MGMYGTMKAEDDDKWRAESDLSTLLEAAKIKKDKKRYAAALRCAKEKRDNLRDVAGEGALDEAADA